MPLQINKCLSKLSNKSVLIAAALATLQMGCAASGNQAVGYQSQLLVAQNFLNNSEYGKAYGVLDEVAAQHEEHAQVQIELAEIYLWNGAYLKAGNAFRAAERAGGETVRSRLGLGRLALAKNEPQIATTHFNRVLELAPEQPDALNGLGVGLDLMGRHRSAREFYRRALDVDPNDLDVVNVDTNLGCCYTVVGL